MFLYINTTPTELTPGTYCIRTDGRVKKLEATYNKEESYELNFTDGTPETLNTSVGDKIVVVDCDGVKYQGVIANIFQVSLSGFDITFVV